MRRATGSELLFHYTSAAGLKGILESLVLWATDAQFLNDSMELRFGRSDLIEALRSDAGQILEAPNRSSGERSRAELMKSAAEALEGGLRAALELSHRSVYVACLCEAGDLLSQWRGYGAGGGYSLGLSKDALASLPPVGLTRLEGDGARRVNGDNEEVVARLDPVRYGADGVVYVIEYVRQNLVPESGVGFPGAKGWNRAFDLILPELAFIKDAAFEEEREWRLALATSPDWQEVRFRDQGGTLVPFAGIPLSKDAVREVLIGPGADFDRRELGVRRLLSALEMTHVAVRRSAAPYRG